MSALPQSLGEIGGGGGSAGLGGAILFNHHERAAIHRGRARIGAGVHGLLIATGLELAVGNALILRGSNAGSLPMFAAMRLASSRVSALAVPASSGQMYAMLCL